MINAQVRAWLDELGSVDGPDAVRELARDIGPALLATPGLALALVVGEEADAERRLLLFQLLVDDARRDRENGGRLGEGFLLEASGAIVGLAMAGALDRDTAMALAQAYASAGLEAPDCLAAFILDDAADMAEAAAFADDFDTVLDKLRDDTDGDDYMLHAVLNEMLGAIPAPLRSGLVHHVAVRDEAWCGRLALYWLLDAALEVRLTAADGIGERMRHGTLDATAAAPLPLVRNWIPEDDARTALDAVLGDAHRSEFLAHLGGLALRPARLLASLPDGSGSQSVAVELAGEDGPAVALVLLKAGQGVKDAFVASGGRAIDAVREQAEEAASSELAWEALEPILAAALAEGLSAGRPAPPGLIDVAERCGLAALRPRRLTARAWLAHVDPDGEIAALPAAERGRLVNASAHWPHHHPLVETWFEGTAVVAEALERAGDLPQAEAGLWTAIEEQRGFWALLMLKSAHVLKAAGEDADWRSFAATAAALLDDRPLREIPVMEFIFEASIAAWRAEEHGPGDGDPG